MERRDFVKLSSFAAFAGLPGRLIPGSQRVIDEALGDNALTGSAGLADDEAFWRKVREAYVTSPDLLDFDNANTAPTPAATFDAYVRRGRTLRQAPSTGFGKMWSDADRNSRTELAKYLGVNRQQLALTPNATYGLNTVLHGFPLNRGDEILVTNHEYPDMIETVLQRAKREGIVVQTVRLPSATENPLDLARRVENAITPSTKLLLVSHVSAWSGEILPVKETTAAARARGVAVLVDAAQSVGILDVDFNEIGCDFLATSLHKGLGAPMGTGALLMRPEHIGKVWPLHPPSWETTEYPMDLYEWTGTFNVAAYASVVDALAFHNSLGAERKRARLQYLGDHWQNKLASMPGVTLLTPRARERSFGVGAFMVKGIPSAKLVKDLRARGIVVQDKAGRHSPFDNAVRVSPGVYATIAELDRFVEAIGQTALNSSRAL